MRWNKEDFYFVGVVGAAIGFSILFIPREDGNEVYVTVIAFVAIAAFMFIRYRIAQRKKKPLIEKINRLRKEGHELLTETEQELNESDKQILNAYRRKLILSVILGTLVIMGGGVFLLQVAEVPNPTNYQLALVIVIASGFGAWLLYTIRKHDEKVSVGRKTIVRGIVTDKLTDSDENTTYYKLIIDGLEVFVKKKVFTKYEIGDAIEIHLFKPIHNLVLFETKLG
jgi:F0F1-type ATP synthase assembly protein I